MSTPPLLSKHRILSGLQCLKFLYLSVYQRELIPAPSPALRALFDQGTEVGRLARTRHPEGVLVPHDPTRHDEAVAFTRAAMADPRVPTLFEAAFTFDGVRVRTDLLVRQPEGTWSLEEVKSSTRVKDLHHLDVAIQVHVLRGCGVPLRRAGILYLDKRYLRGTGGLDVSDLFRFVDLLPRAIELLPDIRDAILHHRRVLQGGRVPEVAPGPQCSSPHDCPLRFHCIPPQSPYTTEQLPRSGPLRARLAARGVTDIRHLPPDIPLSPTQARVAASVLRDEEYLGPDLESSLTDVGQPLHFLDFEAFAPAVPRYPGTGVYESLPTQWSLHVLHEDGRLLHTAYLHDQDTDPRGAFLDSLLSAVAPTGTVVVYSSYERTQLRKLAERFPERAAAVRSLIERLQDLMAIVRKHYYHPKFRGSYSIKRVLPALVPDLDYADLDVSDGRQAAAVYPSSIAADTPRDVREKLRASLLDYCRRDTLALVRIREVLLERCRRPTASPLPTRPSAAETPNEG